MEKLIKISIIHGKFSVYKSTSVIPNHVTLYIRIQHPAVRRLDQQPVSKRRNSPISFDPFTRRIIELVFGFSLLLSSSSMFKVFEVSIKHFVDLGVW